MGLEAGVGTLLGGPLVGLGIYQGQEQKAAQKRAERRQDAAELKAESRAAAELRKQEQERRRLNQKKPNIANMLSRAREGALAGAGSTQLTSTATNRSTLGQQTPLGIG